MAKRLIILLLFVLVSAPIFAQVPDTEGRDFPQNPSNENGDRETLKLFIPNAFTPNDDGVNDYFFIQTASFQQFQFLVFDRWGNEVYQSITQGFRWDGKINGKPLPSDIYVFMFSGHTLDNLEVKRSGTISIVR